MTTTALQIQLYEFIKSAYPNIYIQVIDNSDNQRSIYFIEEKFVPLYPKQRFHYLLHLIPENFYEENLKDAIWYELAPHENPGDLDYHDDETIEAIKDTILDVLQNKTNFIEALDNIFVEQKINCRGNFSYSKEILSQLDFSQEDQFDIFHVLMGEGAFCDCEILYNIFRDSKYANNYWTKKVSFG